MPQLDKVSACPGCGEPLEQDDRYCGACGTDLQSVAPRAAAAEPVRTPTEPDFTLPPPQPPAQFPPLSPPSAPAPPAPAPAPAKPQQPPHPPRPVDERTREIPKPQRKAEPSADKPTREFPKARPGGRATSARKPQPQPQPQPQQQPRPPSAPASRLPSLDPRTAPAAGGPVADPRAVASDPRARDASPPDRDANPVTCTVCGSGTVDHDGYCEECGRAQPGERDHVELALGGVAAVSDLGLRHHRNEDAFTISATALPDGSPAVLAVVCDGVSSSSRPDEASAAAAGAAVEALLDSLPRGVSGQQAMHDALLTAARAVADLADDEERAPGRNAPACTIVSAVATGGTLTVGWIGDSRAYWVPLDGDGGTPGGAPARLTEDDSWAAQMVAAGLLTEAEAMRDHRAHAITAWLGADAQDVEPHTASFKPDRPGVVIVCTDGLWNYAESADEMARLVPGQARVTPLPSARHLVRHALDSGGHDNVTVAVVPFPVDADQAGRA